MIKFLRIKIRDITKIVQDFEVLEISNDEIPDDIKIELYNMIHSDSNTVYDIDEITGLFKTNCILQIKPEYTNNVNNLDKSICPITGMFIENMKTFEGYLGITNEKFIANTNDDFLMQLGEKYQILATVDDYMVN